MAQESRQDGARYSGSRRYIGDGKALSMRNVFGNLRRRQDGGGTRRPALHRRRKGAVHEECVRQSQ